MEKAINWGKVVWLNYKITFLVERNILNLKHYDDIFLFPESSTALKNGLFSGFIINYNT